MKLKQTHGVFISDPDHFVAEARVEILALFEKLGIPPVILSCGARCTDRSIVANSRDGTLLIPQMQSAIREILEIVQALREDQLAAGRLCWTFEHGRIHCAARADGVAAVLLVSAEVQNSTTIDGLLSDFLSAEC